MSVTPRQLQGIAVTTLIAGFVMYVAGEGLPTRRTVVLAWIALAVLAFGVNRPLATLRSFATTWLPLFGALCAYDILRGASDEGGPTAHTWPQLQIDLWLGGGTTPTEHLQDAFWTPGAPAWWDYAAWAVYQSHFLVPLLLAVVLWSVRHRLATPYIIGLAALSWSALATYWLYPAQPPWMTARDGLTGDVTRVVHQMWADVGVERAARLFTTAPGSESRYANPVAALPSLHAAFPMFIAMMLRGVDRRLDILLVTYVLAMGTTLVYAGEHFTFDIVLGWAYAAIIATVAVRYQSTSRGPSPSVSPQSFAEGIGGNPVAAGVALRSRYTARSQTDDTRS